MTLHFERDEFEQRLARVRATLAERGLSGLLAFKQETMFYLTGYDSFGFCFFQCLYVGVDGRLALLTRAPDLRQAQHTSFLDDIRVWVDGQGSNPPLALKTMLAEFGLANARLGVEYYAYGLNAYQGRQLDDALAGFCELEDASSVVDEHRLVKSAAELVYVERAAELADAALKAAGKTAAPGVFEGDVLAAMQSAVFRGGGDYPGNEFIIGSGRDALLCRYFSGRRFLDQNDQLTLEFAGAYRHYHCCLMRTLIVGEPSRAHIEMYDAARGAIEACVEALSPGRALGEVFDAHARVLDDSGLGEHRMNACGYSLGATFAPIWMDPPMLYTGNPIVAATNMVFFIHIIIANSVTEQAMTLGQTVVVTESGSRVLGNGDLGLVVV